MLARANRVVRAADFRSVVRRGRRSSTPHAVYYRITREPEAELRFGFIVSRAVGGSVVRNQLTRRLRAIGRSYVEAGVRGHDVVVRALPGAADLDWPALERDVHEGLDAGLGVTR